jgi:hypothetical protein
MKLLFERAADNYNISPKLLFQKEIGSSTTKPPLPKSEETLDEPLHAANTAKPLLYNGQLVDFAKVDTFDINLDAFSHKWKNGEKIDRTGSDATHQAAESRATRKIVSAIKESGGNNSQRTLALYHALCNEDIRPVSKACGFQSEKCLLCCIISSKLPTCYKVHQIRKDGLILSRRFSRTQCCRVWWPMTMEKRQRKLLR